METFFFFSLPACIDNGSVTNLIYDFISSADKWYMSVLVSEERKVKACKIQLKNYFLS